MTVHHKHDFNNVSSLNVDQFQEALALCETIGIARVSGRIRSGMIDTVSGYAAINFYAEESNKPQGFFGTLLDRIFN